MNRRTLLTLLAVMALGLISQTAAEAGGGGGGAKKNATVNVYNTQAATEAAEGVLFLASGKAAPAANQAAFIAAGGKAVSPGPTPVKFTVAPGAGTIIVTDGVNPPVTLPYAVSAGKTYTYTIGGNNALPTITKQ